MTENKIDSHRLSLREEYPKSSPPSALVPKIGVALSVCAFFYFFFDIRVDTGFPQELNSVSCREGIARLQEESEKLRFGPFLPSSDRCRAYYVTASLYKETLQACSDALTERCRQIVSLFRTSPLFHSRKEKEYEGAHFYRTVAGHCGNPEKFAPVSDRLCNDRFFLYRGICPQYFQEKRIYEELVRLGREITEAEERQKRAVSAMICRKLYPGLFSGVPELPEKEKLCHSSFGKMLDFCKTEVNYVL